VARAYLPPGRVSPRGRPSYRRAAWAACAACLSIASAACSRRDGTGGGEPAVRAARCVVHLHGKGGRGAAASLENGVAHLRPSGNADAWGGLEWRYFPEPRYEEVRATVANSIAAAGCERAVVHGFSNGGAFAGKLYCRGETFGGRVAGYVVDDPVPDGAVLACKPAPGVRVKVYSTGALSVAADGWACEQQDFTCEGGRTIGIARYGQALGVEVTPSIHTKHAPYERPPEYEAWR
jgi:hypothetical protein